jgi:hypothetical protein
MYNLLLALGAGTLVTIFFGWLLGMPRVVVGYGIIPGIIAMIAVLIVLSRKTGKKLQTIMDRVQAELQPRQGVKPEPARFDRAVNILREGYKYKRWQIFVGSTIDAQIGMLLYLQKKFDEAEPHLENAVWRNWVAKAMLAVNQYRRKNYGKMKAIFEKTAKVAKKESLLWNLYAWCLWKSGDTVGAIDALSRGGEHLKDDERLNTNKAALQKGKRMKMRGWNEMWYQFHLEAPPQPKPQVDRRSIYRGR